VRRLVAEFVTWLPDLRLGRGLVPYSLGPVTRYRLHDASVALLDWRLDEVGRREVDLPAGARLLAATPDLVGVVAADPATLTVIAGDRRVGLPTMAHR
jgi:hypothetical protein